MIKSDLGGEVDVLLEELFFDGDLAFEEEGAFAVALLVELDFVRDGGREPGAADDAEHPALELEFGDILIQANVVIDVRLSHDSFRRFR